MKNIAGAIILAAGDGKRMKSHKSKVCCEVLFKPMLSWVIDACIASGILAENICVVISDTDNGVSDLLQENINIAVQKEKLGTGHAVLMAKNFINNLNSKGIRQVAVLNGDAPLISPLDLLNALEVNEKKNADLTVITAVLPEGCNYGRIIRKNGRVEKIREKKNCTSEELKINEVNSGAYWFNVKFILENIEKISMNELTHEYYLTDLVETAYLGDGGCEGYVCEDKNAILGANDRNELAKLNEIARDMVISKLYDDGVSIPICDGVIISPDVKIGEDTLILPGTIIKGKTTIGRENTVGANSCISSSTIGDGNTIEQTKITDSIVGNGCRIGPFTQLRPNSKISNNVKIGNFVEVKNSSLGEQTSLAHLTYIGDSDFGEHINVGCGVVTVNYNGLGKYRTVVEDNVFIGCNSNLIAPVTVKKGAYVAAASTITNDISENSLAIGRVKVVEKENGALKYRKK